MRSYGAYTNKVYVGSYRASGVADMTFAVESHMDMIAHKLGIDPLEFRLKNAIKEGDTAVNGSRVPRHGLVECLTAVKEKLGLPKEMPDGHGVGIALCEWRSGAGPSTASISVNEDGTVSLLTGSVDISGSDTSLASIAAEALGIGLEQVIVAKRDTDLAPFTGPSGGSRIVYSQGKAVELAAEDTRNKLLGLAADRLGVPQDALVCAAGRVYVQDNPPQGFTLGQLASMSVNSRTGPITGNAALSTLPYAPVFSAQAAEVVVDRDTGQVKLTRYIQCQDVGVAINPMAVEGQLEGGAVQGIGRALTEDMLFDADTGAVRNPSFATYLMPLALDLPDLETLLVRGAVGGRPLWRKGSGGTAGIRPTGSHSQRHLRRRRCPNPGVAAVRGKGVGRITGRGRRCFLHRRRTGRVEAGRGAVGVDCGEGSGRPLGKWQAQSQGPGHHLTGPPFLFCYARKGGGSARESNPPTPLFTRHNGFEVRKSHRAPSTPWLPSCRLIGMVVNFPGPSQSCASTRPWAARPQPGQRAARP